VTIAPLLQHINTIKLYHTKPMIEREGKITAKRTPQKKNSLVTVCIIVSRHSVSNQRPK